MDWDAVAPQAAHQQRHDTVRAAKPRQPRSGGSKTPFEFHPGASPIRDDQGRQRFLFIDAIAAILRKLFHRFLVGEDIAMNATQKRDGNFQYRNKKVIRRLADFAARHCR